MIELQILKKIQELKKNLRKIRGENSGSRKKLEFVQLVP